MAISVCICTMTRPDDLRRALEALSQSGAPPLEVLVSDDSPADDRRSEEVCRSFAGVHYAPGPRRGLSANRNAVVRRCRGDWVHFIDDDVQVPPGFYAEAERVVAGLDTDCVVTGYQYDFQPEAETPWLTKPAYCGLWAHMSPAEDGKANCVVINAALFPRGLFEAALFDERFRYGWEEADITQHAIALGKRVEVAPTLVVDHYPSPSNRDLYAKLIDASAVYAGLKRQFSYNRSLGGTLLFATVGVGRLLLHRLRARGVAGATASARGAIQGYSLFLDFLMHKSEPLQPLLRTTDVSKV
ncbi:putative glycosyltransferase EpsH [Botrimarina colliarenosi]|uniref:Putative glycosyltransferase EpsH n=1 Tax=Botrimarina colliarenosi TaxID=2528001 RepID=A0A5C6AEX3_9BACT|nr:glycosyltransferase family 2 protein [Botrimarina colliarenosi]TWT97967.1 putative glycosyltransferase EpsH [Botrimarina colliarenosi]